MKRLYLALSLALCGMMFVACNGNEELERMKAQSDSLQAIVDSKDDEINSLFDMLNQIEDNLAMISDKYSSVQTLKQSSLEGNTSVKGEISTQLATIDEMLADNKKKLAALNSKLAALGQQNSKLEEFVARLQERVDSQEQQIAGLLSELEKKNVVIADLNRNVDNLTASNNQKDATIAQQTADANRAYFVVGTADELTNLGILTENGGFLGIGKKSNASTEMDTKHFQAIDRTKVTTITVNMKRAKVKTQHPAGSYELVPDQNDSKVTAYLRIIDQAAFWKYTKYLVITNK